MKSDDSGVPRLRPGPISRWQSLDDIVAAFSLPTPSSFPLARAALLRCLSDIHPDRNSGQFANAEEEEQYYHIKSAMDYLDQNERVSSSNLPAPYVDHTSRLLATKWESIKSTERNLATSISEKTKSKFRRRKIAAAVIGSAIIALLGFSEKLVSNPLIVKFFTYLDAHAPVVPPILAAALFVGVLISGTFFARAWHNEMKYKLDAANIITDQGLSALFKHHSIEHEISDSGQFSSMHLFTAIQSKDGYVESWLHKLLPPIVSRHLPVGWRYRRQSNIFAEDPVLTQQVTDLVLEKLEMRAAIVPTATGAFIPIFRLSDAAREQLYGL